ADDRCDRDVWRETKVVAELQRRELEAVTHDRRADGSRGIDLPQQSIPDAETRERIAAKERIAVPRDADVPGESARGRVLFVAELLVLRLDPPRHVFGRAVIDLQPDREARSGDGGHAAARRDHSEALRVTGVELDFERVGR